VRHSGGCTGPRAWSANAARQPCFGGGSDQQNAVYPDSTCRRTDTGTLNRDIRQLARHERHSSRAQAEPGDNIVGKRCSSRRKPRAPSREQARTTPSPILRATRDSASTNSARCAYARRTRQRNVGNSVCHPGLGEIFEAPCKHVPSPLSVGVGCHAHPIVCVRVPNARNCYIPSIFDACCDGHNGKALDNG